MADMYTILRIVNASLGASVIFMIAYRWKSWAALPVHLRFFGIGLFALLIGNSYAAIDSIVKGIPGSARVTIITMALVWLTIACFIPRKKTPDREAP